MRHITKETQLYTKMVMDKACVNNMDKLEDFIGNSRVVEPPLAVQLGGNDPESMGRAAAVCEQYGTFTEINLNVGVHPIGLRKLGLAQS